MYKRGEIVRIKDDANTIITDLAFMPTMNQYCGRTCMISKVHPNPNKKWYEMEEFGFWWDEQWIEPISNIKDVSENEISLLFQEA